MSLNKQATPRISCSQGINGFIVIFVDIALCFLATWLALCLRYEKLVSIDSLVLLVGGFSAGLILPIGMILGIYRIVIRYSDWHITFFLAKAIAIYFGFFAIALLFTSIEGIPRSLAFIQPILLFAGMSAVRLLAQFILGIFINKSRQKGRRTLALIYGAGSAGRQIASGLYGSAEVQPIGFVDDNPRLWHRLVNGLLVYSPSEILHLIRSKGVTDILVALPSIGRARQKEILMLLSELPVYVRTLPGLSTLVNGIVKIEDIRNIEIDDVLGRATILADENYLHQNILGKCVLVTGAGGSIGSELCRQILAQKPKTIVLFELNEFALYKIEQELVGVAPQEKIIPILGSVLDERKLTRVIRQYGVDTIYHTAAYKHVPMIEMNPAAGIWNNVLGTLSAVNCACQEGVETFVLISTDKAVRPTNVMGCSKRVAELILQARSSQGSQSGAFATKLTMVRFGNVLGSSGSVVPLFREQIKNGGPVTVTHPEVMRYFMTIPEAAQLVIQAGAIGEGGDVMVLDMGDPIKIVDLAKRMIHLSGFLHKDIEAPDGDIEIIYTGLRPGEKLYEELLIGDNILPTKHPRIMRAVEHSLSWNELEHVLFELKAEVEAENSSAILTLLRKAIPEFNPQ